MKKYIKISFVLILTVLIGCYFVYNLKTSDIPTLPHQIQIDITQKGAVYETQFRVAEPRLYYFLLKFWVKDYEEDKGTDLRKMYEFIGEMFYDSKTNEEILTGTPIPLKLTVYKIDDSNQTAIILENYYNTKGRYSVGAYDMDRIIAKLRLDKGTYGVRLETLEDLTYPILKDRAVFLDIRKPYGK